MSQEVNTILESESLSPDVDVTGIQTQGLIQEGAMSQTFVNFYEDDNSVARLAEIPDNLNYANMTQLMKGVNSQGEYQYGSYPIENKSVLNQRPTHPGDNYLCATADQIQQARKDKDNRKKC